MKKLTFLVLALVAVLAFSVLGASAARSHRVATQVTIAYNGGSGPYYQEASFSGKVKSSKKKCRKGRSVKVKNTNGVVVGTDTSSSNGAYAVSAAGGADPGSYRAIAKKKVKGRTICKKGKSPTITAP